MPRGSSGKPVLVRFEGKERKEAVVQPVYPPDNADGNNKSRLVFPLSGGLVEATYSFAPGGFYSA